MKLLLTVLASVLCSTAAITSSAEGCGHLSITLINNTGSECVLQHSKIYNYSHVVGEIPQVIADGYTAPKFSIQQTYTSGPGIQLYYVCKNKTIVISSRQNYCFLSAGDVFGEIDSSENIYAKYKVSLGDYSAHLPGQITWKFY